MKGDNTHISGPQTKAVCNEATLGWRSCLVRTISFCKKKKDDKKIVVMSNTSLIKNHKSK